MPGKIIMIYRHFPENLASVCGKIIVVSGKKEGKLLVVMLLSLRRALCSKCVSLLLFLFENFLRLAKTKGGKGGFVFFVPIFSWSFHRGSEK